MTQHEEMKVFLESMRTDTNRHLIDAVELGYDACFEVNMKNLALGVLPVAAATTLGGMYGTQTGLFAPDDNSGKSKTIEYNAEHKAEMPSSTVTLKDTKGVKLAPGTEKKVAEQKPVTKTVHDTVFVDKPGKTVHDTVVVNKPGETVHDTVYVHDNEGKSESDGILEKLGKKVSSWFNDEVDENKFHPTVYNEVDHINNRINDDMKKLAKYGWHKVSFENFPGKLSGLEALNNRSYNFSRGFSNVERCAKKMDVDIKPAMNWMISPSGYVAYNVLTGAVFSTMPYNHTSLTVDASDLQSNKKFTDYGTGPDDEVLSINDLHDGGNSAPHALRLEDEVRKAQGSNRVFASRGSR